MKSRFLVTAAPALFGAMLLAGWSASGNAQTVKPASTPEATGPFAQESTLPFHAPDFSKIKDTDYQPAVEQGIAIELGEIEAIADDPAAPTFDNTLVAMQRAGAMLTRAYTPFNQMVAANTNDTLDAADTALSPKIAAMRDAIYLNDKLFQRVKAVYDNRAKLGLTGEDAMLAETTYADFVHAGALLTAAQKEQLKTMNARIAALETEFSQKLTDGTAAKAPVFDSAAELAGLSQAEIDAAAALAAKMGQPGKFALPLINTTQQPQLTRLTNRESRRKLFEASINRSNGGDKYDTTAIVIELAKLRAQQAALLGQPSFAAYAMYDRMVKDPAKAIKFMDDFVPALAATQTREAKMLQDMAKSEGQDIALEPWDWGYYAEKVRKAKYDIDDAAVKPYFGVWKTLEDGVFYAANKFYGITFKRRTDIPTYHPDMRVYTVYDKDGSELGLFEYDPFARPNKQGGAWMGNFVEQSYLLGDRPVIYNSINITPPAAGEPALATADDVTTMFHEFGHALHGFFASQKYPSLSGTNTARDFVEFPSQFNENFAFLPEILNHFAQNAQGETIPPELVAKIEAAKKFNQSLEFGETLEAAMLDMKWHALTPANTPTDAQAFEKQALGEIKLDTRLIPPRYRTPYFRHIWSNGYSAGYYSYIWTEMLAHDAWDWVVTHGGPTRANGEHIRASFLGQGHTKDYGVMYRDFAGRDPGVKAMIEARGLDQK
ncbi:MAG: M3 family metallopeptidase [Candidatus Andeanibacterium colombiense]|uniref:M3 family metallopeptidase n=1 Tax=Candidatus Andeanibacterium colombiense TaxID=3121345 RepID=A0AAJ5X6J9_9SPHN|nr:MAG: M3 family metallopeptidase [Sphingomonadaceae bacterium]